MINQKYTFLLPAYKTKYFAQALKSIKNQTYRNFKCLVSDDCSPENIKFVFDEIVGDDNRFCYRRNDENMGEKNLVSHWNFLVDQCDSEYLIMSSDDDVYEPFFLEEIDELTNKYPNVNLFRGRAKRIDAFDDLIEKDIFLEEYQSKIEFLYSFFYHNLIQCVAHYVFKTKKLKEIKGFFDLPLAWCSDNATAILMSDNGVCHTPSIVFSFRISDVNISTREDYHSFLKKTKARYLYLNFLEKLIKNIPAKPKNLYDKVLYQRVKLFLYKNVFIDNVYKGALKSSYKDMIEYYRYLDHLHCFSGKLDKLHFFYAWLRMYKARKELI